MGCSEVVEGKVSKQMMVYNCRWKQPPANVHLLANDVHLWCAPLDVPEEKLQSLAQMLAADERTRAERFYFEQDRIWFTVSHGLLRVILGFYSGINPDKLQFSYNSKGKPYLAETVKGKKLYFNMAHSYGLALYAVMFDRQIGVDLERIHGSVEFDLLANSILSEREKPTLLGYPPHEKLEMLFRYWTCKEAYVKARGEGLGLPLEQVDISLEPGVVASLSSVGDDNQEASRWSLRELNPASGYAAALVVEGLDYHLRCWHWSQMP